jgi:hypothetical protein
MNGNLIIVWIAAEYCIYKELETKKLYKNDNNLSFMQKGCHGELVEPRAGKGLYAMLSKRKVLLAHPSAR